MVDRFSGYIFVKKLTNLTSQHTCEVLQRWYTQFGWPEYQRSDAGSTFAAEYQDWCVKNDITPQISSAYHSQSNGLAESAVKNSKLLLKQCIDANKNYEKSLSVFLNTPRGDKRPRQNYFLAGFFAHQAFHM